jgi:hypothetical protein
MPHLSGRISGAATFCHFINAFRFVRPFPSPWALNWLRRMLPPTVAGI